MKVLYISPKSEFTNQMQKAFKENGIQVVYLDDRQNFFLPSILRGSFLWKITRRIPFLRKRSNRMLNEKVMELARGHTPDLLFTNKGMNIYPSTIVQAKNMGIKTATWFMENTYQEKYVNWFRSNYINYDYVFTNDSFLFEKFANTSSAKLHDVTMTVDTDRFIVGPITDEEREKYSCDVCFVGAFDPRREKVLASVAGIKGVDLKIFGWEGWKKSSLASHYQGPLNLEQMVKLYNCARICLNINGQSQVPNVELHGVNLKTFEIPAAGGFQLSDYRRDVESLFKVGEEIEVFRDSDELIRKIQFYLANEDSRNKIAYAGRQRVLVDHTLVQRVHDMLNFIDRN